VLAATGRTFWHGTGLADEQIGVQLMKPVDTLDDVLERANRHRIFGTKMPSVIKDAGQDGVMAIVNQQFGYGARISAAGLVPIIEPEVSITSPHKDEAETMLRDALHRHISALPHNASHGEADDSDAAGPVRRSCRRPSCAEGLLYRAATAVTKRASCWPRIRA